MNLWVWSGYVSRRKSIGEEANMATVQHVQFHI